MRNFFEELIPAVIDFPGSWHDSKLAHAAVLVHSNLSDERTSPRFAVQCNSAFFAVSRMVNVKIVWDLKIRETGVISECEELAAIGLVLLQFMLFERQSPDWKVRAVKALFGCLWLPLLPDSEKRKMLLTICAHLFNCRSWFVSLNQICAAYVSPESGS